MNSSRRRFITGLAALAATSATLAVLPPAARLTAQQRLVDMMKTGRVIDQRFLFDTPIEISGFRLVVARCILDFTGLRPEFFDQALITMNGEQIHLVDSHIHVPKGFRGFGISVLPQPGDMTQTLQSAITGVLITSPNYQRPEIKLEKGTYRMGKPLNGL